MYSCPIPVFNNYTIVFARWNDFNTKHYYVTHYCDIPHLAACAFIDSDLFECKHVILLLAI